MSIKRKNAARQGTARKAKPLSKADEPILPPRPISTKRAAKAPARTKAETVLNLLRGPAGAALSDMMEATNWQPHSVRGFLAGHVRKKLGLPLTSEKDKDGHRRYRIAS